MKKLIAAVKPWLSATGHERLYSFGAALLAVWLTIPLAVQLSGGKTPPEPGMQELKTLISESGGRPNQQDLLKFESKYGRTRAAALSMFLRGYLHYSDKDYAGAIEALDASTIAGKSAIGAYALFYRAESEEQSGKSSAALSDYANLYDKYPDSLMARDCRIGAARISLALGNAKGALTAVEPLQESSDPDAALLTGNADEAMGSKSEAVALYRKIYFRMPASLAADQASQRLDALGASLADNPGSEDETVGRADKLFEAKQYTEAAAAYHDLAARFPGAARSDQVEIRYGISLLNSKQPSDAAGIFQAVTERDSDLHAQALFYRTEAARRSNQLADASADTDRLIAQHRQSKWAEMALYNLAGYLDKHGRSADASARFRQIVASYPNSEYAAEASYNLGWQAYKDKQYADAARLLEQHLAHYTYPDSKYMGEAGFWSARAEERIGNKPRALALYDLVTRRYRYGYDGHVASQRAASLRAANPGLKAETIKPGSDLEQIEQNLTAVGQVTETADGSEAPALSRADDLETIGLADLAVRELNHALEAAPTSPRINLRLAQVYSHRGETFQATLILRRAYPDLFSYSDADLPREAWEIFFPLRDWETIKQEAKRYGIDPYIAAGLIRQESVFNPNAISRVGARGLMQLMPATGELIAKREDVGRISANDLYNPTINIKLGMNYLAQLIGQFGKVEYAAAAYNAGPGRARQWISDRGSLDMDEWVESIPFTETRGYVQGVLRNAANYRRLYR